MERHQDVGGLSIPVNNSLFDARAGRSENDSDGSFMNSFYKPNQQKNVTNLSPPRPPLTIAPSPSKRLDHSDTRGYRPLAFGFV